MCTNFFKENKGDDDAVDKGSSATVKHASGDQCVDFEVKKKTIRTNNNYYSSPRSSDDLTTEEQQQLLDDLDAQLEAEKKNSSSTQN